MHSERLSLHVFRFGYYHRCPSSRLLGQLLDIITPVSSHPVDNQNKTLFLFLAAVAGFFLYQSSVEFVVYPNFISVSSDCVYTGGIVSIVCSLYVKQIMFVFCILYKLKLIAIGGCQPHRLMHTVGKLVVLINTS